MKNKRSNLGFTLIELLCVLVIPALLVTLVGRSFVKIINDAETELSESQEKSILNAAEKWATENSGEFDDIEGSSLQIGADIVFVLDFSGSMGFSSNFISTPTGKISRYQAMIEALDSSVPILMPEDSDNKISIVSYGETVKTILPLDKYKMEGSQFVKWTKTNSGDDFGIISFPNLYNSSGKKITQTYKMQNGVTYTQGGILGATQILLSNSNVVNRIPVIVLFTDGEPTAYYPGNKFVSRCQSCGGSWNLAAARYMIEAGVYAKSSIKSYYQSQLFFYTVGLGIGVGSPGELVLNPTKENIELSTSDSKRRELANYLKQHNGSSAYNYADKSFINVLDAEQLKDIFQNISNEVIEATKVTQLCVTVDELKKGGYLSKDAKINDTLGETIYVLMSENAATNQYVFSVAKTDEQKKQCKALIDQKNSNKKGV